METGKVEIVSNASSLQALSKAEIDVQIATAKQYPRNIKSALEEVSFLATMDEETAQSCFYALKRKSGNGEIKLIEGVSVRMAEILASCWGNLRVATRIIGSDGNTITAQGVCHDLEKNVAVNLEVSRPIRYKNGGKYTLDMQTLTGNTAASIAFRNAVLKVIPKAIIKKVIDDVKNFSIKKNGDDLEKKRNSLVKWFEGKGVSVVKLLEYAEKERISDIDAETFTMLKAAATAINDGEITIKAMFLDEKPEELTKDKKTAMKAKMKAESKKEGTKPILP